MKELIGKVFRILQTAVQRGASDVPFNVAANVKRLVDAGGQVTLAEVKATQDAIKTAAAFSVYADEEKEELRTLLAEAQSMEKNVSTQPALEVAATLQAREDTDDENDLRFSVRLLKSGITVDGHYDFSAEAVRQSVGLFEGVQCFADHAPEGNVPSVRDLVGWFVAPHVVDLDSGVVAVDATLHVLKASEFSKMLREVAECKAFNTVGLSINGTGTHTMTQGANGGQVRRVDKFTAMSSCDLVTKPNAGGAILELRAAIYTAASRLTSVPTPAKNITSTVTAPPAAPDGNAAVLSELEELRNGLQQDRLSSQIDKLIASSNLPTPALKMVESRVRTAETIQAAKDILNDAVSIWAVAIEDGARKKTTDVTVTAQPTRKILALQGMIAGMPIDEVQPYSSLRQAYSELSGLNVSAMSPQEYARSLIRGAWGFDSSVSSRITASIDETDWPYALGQALLREVVRQYQLPKFNEWRDLVGPNISNLNDMRETTRIRTGYFDVLPTVAKGGTYQPLAEPSEEVITYTPTKRGGTADFTWEDALNDDLGRLKEIPGKLALSAKVTLWYYVLNEIAKATPTSMTYDDVAWFHADHSNLGSTALTVAGITAVRKAIMTQTVLSASTINIGATPKYLWIPPSLEGTARKILMSDLDPDIADYAAANPWKDAFEIRIIPFWDAIDDNAWAMTADPAMVPVIEVGFLGGKETPDLATEAENSGSNFSADKVTYRIRQVFGLKPLDHRGVYKQVPA
uniref:Putative capsid protein n=1 Tax=viral metagenome TaxID=1070528 RepID=A0A6M3K9I3_9ZZZZ